MNGSSPKNEAQAVQLEIDDLEKRLKDAKTRLISQSGGRPNFTAPPPQKLLGGNDLTSSSAHHYLLLLSDSALPLGSFAFSSGLESYLAHTRPASSFLSFLTLSLSSYASSTLPFVLAAYRAPSSLFDLDDALDAATMCTVGRRASIAQGRALLSIWDKSLAASVVDHSSADAIETLKRFSALLKGVSSTAIGESVVASAHLGPLFGVISRVLGLSLEQVGYVVMLSHVKALLSAAVRASIFGPYQAQKLLASKTMQERICEVIERERDKRIEDAGQSVPVMDLWIGRHEMLYSRIFNS